LFPKRCSIKNLRLWKISTKEVTIVVTHRRTLAENSFSSEDKEQGKTRRRNIKSKGGGGGGKRKATFQDLLIYQISPSTVGIFHTKSVKMHGYETGQYIKPTGHELQWHVYLMDILV
jgi:hypothetical protein